MKRIFYCIFCKADGKKVAATQKVLGVRCCDKCGELVRRGFNEH